MTNRGQQEEDRLRRAIYPERTRPRHSHVLSIASRIMWGGKYQDSLR
jgi:hypothetical protein